MLVLLHILLLQVLKKLTQKRFGKKKLAMFVKACGDVVNGYLATLTEDVSWFCKKFDYRYHEEPWKNSKDSVERAMAFLRCDIHK